MSSISVNVEKWKVENGNICFRFQERELFERPWIIIIITIFVVAIYGSEIFALGSHYSLIPCVFLWLFFFLWWVSIPLKSNEEIIERTVHEIMDEVIENDAKAIDKKIKKSFVYYDTFGTYGKITGRFLLVLLNDGEVLEYTILLHSESDYKDDYYECCLAYVVSDNNRHIHAIKPNHNLLKKICIRLSNKAKLNLLIFFILLAGAFSFFICYWLFFIKMKFWSLLLLFSIIIIHSISERIYAKHPNRLTSFVRCIFSIPYIVLYFIIGLIQPFITIVGSYFFIVLITFGIPAIILTILPKIFEYDIRPETIAFITIAVGSMLCSNFYTLTKWIIQHTPLGDRGNHKYETYREALAIYLIHPSNIVFFLYFLYFVFLFVSGYLQIQNGSFLFSNVLDTAILKAFLVFIAFMNMRSKAEVAELDANEIIKGILGLFAHDR